MEGINPGSLPVWVQIVVTLLAAIATAIGAFKAYKIGTHSPPAPLPNQPMLQLIGGAISDKISAEGMVDAIRSVAENIEDGNDEMRRFRKALEHHTDLIVEEHARLREETAEIRRRLIVSANKDPAGG